MNTIVAKIIGISLAVGLTFSASAQKLNYGIKAGSNFAVQSETGDLYNNEDIKIGLHFGAFGNLSLSDNFKLQTEINYEQKGSAYDDVTNSYEYISIPVLARVSLGKSLKTPLHFNIYAGPYSAFLINAESEVSEIETEGQTIDKKDDTENTEIGLVGGFGVNYPINNSNVFLDFRFGLGLTEFDKNDEDLRNKYFGISLGLEF